MRSYRLIPNRDGSNSSSRGIARAFLLCLLVFANVAQPQQPADSLVEIFFTLAELKAPGYFPPGPETLEFENYLYRYYPQTDTYLALAENTVWVLGGEFGYELVNAGELGSVLEALNALPDAFYALWDLTISGTIYLDYNANSSNNLLTFWDFQRLEIEGVLLPDFSDTEQLIYDLTSNFAGDPVGVEVTFSALVNNTSTRKSLAVTFVTPHESGHLTYYLYFDFTR